MGLEAITERIKHGKPVYLSPYREPKVWGAGGIGEYWYGAESGDKSTIAVSGEDRAPMDRILAAVPDELAGKDVVRTYGRRLPLVKILTPKGRLSVQFHDAKNELWVVTGVDKSLAGEEPSLIIGFDPEAIKKYGDGIKDKYRQALEEYGRALNMLIDELEKGEGRSLLDEAGCAEEAAEKLKDKEPNISKLLDDLSDSRKEIERYYNYISVKTGDVIPVPQGTLHALGPGIEVVEPQVPGPTQSLEDGSNYPVRYYFPGFPREGAQKMLDLDRVSEMKASIWDKGEPLILEETGKLKVERLPGGFEDKGMEVRRITLKKGGELANASVKSFHTLVAITGSALVSIGDESFNIPMAEPGCDMLLIPASSKEYKIEAVEDAQIIDTFTPV